MTTGPEPDPYAADRGSGWQVPPEEPGWELEQDRNAQPRYDDSGWHIDLSDVGWAGNAGSDRPDGPQRGQSGPFRYEDRQARNRAGPPDPGYGRAGDSRGGPADRSAGRHARRARPGDDPLTAPGTGPGRYGPVRQRGRYQPDGHPSDGQRTERYAADRGSNGYGADSPRQGSAGYSRGQQPGRYPPDGRQPDRYPSEQGGPDAQRTDRYYPQNQRNPSAPPPGSYPPDAQPTDRYYPDDQRAGRRRSGRRPADGYPQDPQNPYSQDRYRQSPYSSGRSNQDRYDQEPYDQDLYNQDRYDQGPDTDDRYSRDGSSYDYDRYPPEGPPGTQPRRALPPDWQQLTGPITGMFLPSYPLPAPTAPYRAPGQRERTLPGENGTGTASVVRSSGVMAVGTLGSRLTGFLRTIAQSYALGVVALGSAYNLANTLPNVVYNLALGGILTSVIVPLIVSASKRDDDLGEGYDQRMFTLITVALLGITLVATVAAAPLVRLYSGSTITGNTLHLTVLFAYFFIPQIFFYGISSLIGAILNSRGSFAAPMWTPIVNNLVVITILGMYVALAGLKQTPHTISSFDVQLLGFGTTLGIIAQTVALVPALRRVGFRWQPRIDFRRTEVREIGQMAGWMFGYIAGTQVAFLVTTKIAGDTTSGINDYNYAWLLFQLPYAVVGISVITALLPRMSAHASDRRFGLVRADFSTGIRLAAAIVVPCSLVLAALGPKLAELFLGHGATHAAQAHYIGVVFAVFCLGLLPYMIFQLQLRVFYSLHDSKTPALIGLVTMVTNIVANLVALNVLPKSELTAGLGVGFGLANLLGTVISWRILSRRLRGLDGWRIGRSVVRMYAATMPAALVAVVVAMITGNAIVVVFIGGGLAIALYLMFAKALRIEEVTSLTQTVMSRVGR